MTSRNFENIVIMYRHTQDEVVDSDCYTRWETTVVNI